MYTLKFNHEKTCRQRNTSQSFQYTSKSELNDVKSTGPKSPRRTNKNSAQEKDGKYWKRRSSNNEARKARFERIGIEQNNYR